MAVEQIICEWLMKIDKDLGDIALSICILALAIVFHAILTYAGFKGGE